MSIESILAISIAIAGPVVSWLWAIRYFQGQIKQWMTNSDARYADIALRLQRIEENHSRQDVLDSRLARAEQDILDLRRWKHLEADPYVKDVPRLEARVRRIEDDIDSRGKS